MPSLLLTKRSRRLLSLTTTTALLASCSSLLGIEDPVRRDADAGSDSGGVPASIAGKASIVAGSENKPSEGGSGGDPVTPQGESGEGGALHPGSVGGMGGETGGAPPQIECEGSERRCDVYQPQICVSGHWMDDGPECPLACVDGGCQTPASCAPTATHGDCADGVSCCETIWMEGGDYLMADGDEEDGASYPRSVSGFYLDRFEVSVGRFREFHADYVLPIEGAGAHPKIAGTGWHQTWEALPHPLIDGRFIVPVDQDDLVVQLTDECDASTWADGNPDLPINCVNWYVAFAFCAYDGGRLPTEAEWNYAAAAGAEQRPYPWSTSGNDVSIDLTKASFYDYPTPPNELPSPVGSYSAGRGGFHRYMGQGHDDLAGNVYEWSLDEWLDTPPAECDLDCFANWSGADDRVSKGGSFASDYSYLRSGSRLPAAAQAIDSLYGFRCARDLSTKDD